jgi:hypothetical protein
MPVTVCEGETPQAQILQLRAILELPSPRTPVALDSFCGLDRGDVAEMEVSMYDDQNRALYRRSLHLEGGVPDCYDAYDPRDSLSTLPTSRVVMDAICRANGPNEVTGSISARCHLQGTVIFAPEGPPPPPPPPPPPAGCTLGTPPATEVPGATFNVKAHGRGLTTTPLGRFGKAYYCTPEADWPEACADGRDFGPVAREGHPQRRACEIAFVGSQCPRWKGECTGTGNQCPITFDTLIGDNPHPMNANAGCPDPHPNHQENPEVFWGRPAGKGWVFACNHDFTVCGKFKNLVDQVVQ